MRLVAYAQRDRFGVGRLAAPEGPIVPFNLSSEEAARGLLALLPGWLEGSMPGFSDQALDPADVQVRAPIPTPARNLFCVGKNYFEHAHEFAGSGFDSGAASGAIPEAPIVFSKLPQCVIAAGEAVLIDREVSEKVDYEAELAVVIGRGGRSIDRSQALEHVFGYTIVNDVTARDLQGRHKQWLLGKSQDTFCPMGPCLVTADELDGSALDVRCWVNGELRQQGNTSELIFDIPTLISTLSRGVTLYPGDIIATGTPAGVGIGFDPPRYLGPGDRIRIEVQGIGVLENPVEAWGGRR